MAVAVATDAEEGQAVSDPGSLPWGSVVRNANGKEYMRTPDGWKGPDGITTGAGRHPVLVRRGGLSLAQYQFLFRDFVVRTAASRGGGLESEVQQLFRDLRMPEQQPGKGTVVSTQLANTLPDGSVLYSGDPTNPEAYSVFVVQGRRAVRVLGRLDHAFLTVDQVAGADVPEPEWDRPSAKDADRIAEFRRESWRLLYAIKRKYDWCSEFENLMRGFDLSSSVLDELTPLRLVSALPVGTYMVWSDGRRVAWYIRDADAQNQLGTRMVWGTPGMTRHMPRGRVTVLTAGAVMSEASFRRLPQGTLLAVGGARYVKADEIYVTERGTSYRYTYRDIGGGQNLTIMEFPAQERSGS